MATNNYSLPSEQEAIRARCFHPSGAFINFRAEDIEQSIPARFEKIGRSYPHHLAVKTNDPYSELNGEANSDRAGDYGEARHKERAYSSIHRRRH
jgi:hypothetical protein